MEKANFYPPYHLEPVLERRLFRFFCIATGFLSLCIIVPGNIIEQLPELLNLPIALLGIGSLVLYQEARNGHHYYNTLFFLLCAAFNVAWFFNGGISGSIIYFIFPISMYPPIMFQGRKRWICLAGIIVNGCILILISYRYPWLVTPYKHSINRIADLIAGMVTSTLSCALILRMVLGAILLEKKRLQLMNVRMEHEISERKHREEEIRGLAREYRLILATVPLGIVFVKERIIQWANPAFERMFGYALNEMIGMHSTTLHVAENDEWIEREGYSRISKGEQCAIEAMMRRKDGTLFWSHTMGRSVNMADPAEGAIWMVQDISERRQAEENLTESEARYRSLVELSPDAILIMTEEKLIFVNSRCCMLVGAARPEDLYGRNPFEFVHPDCVDRLRKRIERAYQTGEPNTLIEAVFVRMDGSPVEVELSSVPINYRGEKAMQVFAREITERKKLQQEIVKAQKLESLGMLAGGIAHDFNNLLTGIMGNISLARLQTEPSHISYERLTQCEKAAVQASRLTKQLLTFARGGKPVQKRMDIAPLIKDAVSFSLRGSVVKTAIAIDAHLWPIEADRGQLSQVFHNILYNAAQAMPNGGEVTVRAENVLLSDKRPMHLSVGSYVKITIEDGGCGIMPENLPKVFDPYFTTKSQGSGLGLASTYSIVKQHGGAIDVTSTVGVGSCFTVYLPASADRARFSENPNEEASHVGTGKILLMDDERIVRETVSTMLESFGYQVELCADGAEAVDRFRNAQAQGTPFSASILDLIVPEGMGGKQTAKMIKALDRDAVLIVSSGYSNDQVIANFRQYGFSGAISKPFTIEKLAHELEALLASTSG